MCACMYARMYVCINTYGMYVRTYIRMYVHMYIHTYIRTYSSYKDISIYEGREIT